MYAKRIADDWTSEIGKALSVKVKKQMEVDFRALINNRNQLTVKEIEGLTTE
jgi:hypothetical protein